jgi:hypothetical protein
MQPQGTYISDSVRPEAPEGCHQNLLFMVRLAHYKLAHYKREELPRLDLVANRKYEIVLGSYPHFRTR